MDNSTRCFWSSTVPKEEHVELEKLKRIALKELTILISSETLKLQQMWSKNSSSKLLVVDRLNLKKLLMTINQSF